MPGARCECALPKRKGNSIGSGRVGRKAADAGFRREDDTGSAARSAMEVDCDWRVGVGVGNWWLGAAGQARCQASKHGASGSRSVAGNFAVSQWLRGQQTRLAGVEFG